MPYTKRKQKCKQSDGDSGGYVLSYTDKKGKKHKACHTSQKNMQGQIAAIEAEADEKDEDTMVISESRLRKIILEEAKKIATEVQIQKQVVKVLRKEGGAAGLDLLIKAVKKIKNRPENIKDNKSIAKYILKMPGIVRHRDGDIILVQGLR